jgi:hypothetical protein
MNILKEIQSNNMLKLIMVLAAIYLFITYTKKEKMDDLMYVEEAENVSMDVAPPPAKVEDRKTLEDVKKESEKVMQAAQIAQPVLQEATGKAVFEIGSDKQGSEFKRVVEGVPPLAAEELLPKYEDADKFAKENPISKLLKEQNFLISGYHVGINTVLQSNKIAYHDLRSAPPIPKESVGPWSQSSYETPMGANRRQLEIA